MVSTTQEKSGFDFSPAQGRPNGSPQSSCVMDIEGSSLCGEKTEKREANHLIPSSKGKAIPITGLNRP